PLPADVAAKIEKFLHEPPEIPEVQPLPKAAPVPGQPIPTKTTTAPATAEKVEKVEKVEGLPVAPQPRAAKPKPYTPEIGSVEFKGGVREALHAMMCLPEYQLN